MRAKRWCRIAGLALTLAVPRVASAYERQQTFGITTGATFMTTNGGASLGGPNLALHWSYGLWDAVNLVVEADGSAFTTGARPKTAAPEPGIVSTGGVGAVYVFDVSRWVPYAGGIVGAGYFGGGFLASPLVTPDLQLAAGVDYEFSRSWALGVSYREHFFLSETNTYPAFAVFGLRFEYVWGW